MRDKTVQTGEDVAVGIYEPVKNKINQLTAYEGMVKESDFC